MRPCRAVTEVRRAIYATGFVRATATSLCGVLLGLHLARTVSADRAGLIVSAGLAGAAFAAVLVTWGGDRVGRRSALLGLALLGALGTAAVAVLRDPTLLALAAFAGMVNGMGRDRGAALVLEQAALPATTDDQGRTRVLAVHSMLQDLGHALGAGLAGLPALLGWPTPGGSGCWHAPVRAASQPRPTSPTSEGGAGYVVGLPRAIPFNAPVADHPLQAQLHHRAR